MNDFLKIPKSNAIISTMTSKKKVMERNEIFIHYTSSKRVRYYIFIYTHSFLFFETYLNRNFLFFKMTIPKFKIPASWAFHNGMMGRRVDRFQITILPSTSLIYFCQVQSIVFMASSVE